LKQLGIGAGIFCLLSIAGLIAGDIHLIINLTGGAALVLLALAIILSGVLGSGDRIRANYSHEDKHERERRNKWISSLLLMAIPNIVGVIILYYYA
jgi:hypothetical protein